MGSSASPDECGAGRPAEPSAASVDRMWQHGLHLDTMLFQRSNVFMVAESLLVVAYSSVLGVGQSGALATGDRAVLANRVIAAFGVMLALIWVYVADRHLQYYKLVSARLREHVPEYGEVRRAWRRRGPSSLPLVSYSLPALAAIMWVLLLVITWH